MKAEALLALYERVADAPDAIPRLRRFVLDLAVQGRLAEQRVGDEPASELLRRIERAKSQLINAGQIRRPRELGLPEVSAPKFNIPPSWRWVRLDAVGAIVGGGTPPASDLDNFANPGNGVPWLTPADLGGNRNRYIARGARDLTEKGLASSSATLMPKGTVLFTSRAPIGYVAIAKNDLATNQGFKSVVPYLIDLAEFVALVLTAFAPDIDATAPGTTFKEVSGKIVAGLAFPLAPLAEQHRIVAKVDELMALLDRLEAARSAREATRDRLANASLTCLISSDTDPENRCRRGRFVLDNLTALSIRADQINQLRKTILDLAVRGMLVPQISSEGSGTRGLMVTHEDAPFEAPRGWSWHHLGELAELINGDRSKNYPNRAEYQSEGIAWINTGHIQPGGSLSLSTMHYISREKFNSLRSGKIQKGDLIYCLRGATFGKTGFVAPFEEGAIASSLMIVRVGEKMTPRFTYLVLTSPLGRQQLLRFDNGTAQPNLSSSNVGRYWIPVPPLAEQHRIVAKVDELMALCDRLEAALQSADATRARLLEALLHEALPSETIEREAA